MKLDPVSYQLAKVIFWLKDNNSGSVSEVWYDQELIDDLEKQSKLITNINSDLSLLTELIEGISDTRRKDYLEGIVKSIEFQTQSPKGNLVDRFEMTYGHKLDPVSEDHINKYVDELRMIMEKLKINKVEEFYQRFSLKESDLETEFSRNINIINELIPEWMQDFPDQGFEVEIVSNKPWTAFNYHTQSYKSKIEINSEAGFSKPDLFRVASHEGYCGHHAELSLKDKLLQQGRGEHGFVLVLSPQVFISEALAEVGFDYFIKQESIDQEFTWCYDRIIFAGQNLAAQMFDSGEDLDVIRTKLSNYLLTHKTISNIINFISDPDFITYAPVYDVAYHWLTRLLNKSDSPEELLKEMFTLPTASSMY